jgi:hypothetical protein
MGLNTVRISFYTDVEATDYAQIEEAIHNLLDQLAKTQTDLAWDDVDWQLTHAPEPLTRKGQE